MAANRTQNDSVDPGGFHEITSGQQNPAAPDVDSAVDPGSFHEISAGEDPASCDTDEPSGSSTDPRS